MITPIFFTLSSIQVKYLSGPKHGFDASKLSFGSYALVGFILSIFLLNHFVNNYDNGVFSFKMLGLGLFGSIVNTLGIVLINKAYSVGPMGPVAALGCIQSIMFTTI